MRTPQESDVSERTSQSDLPNELYFEMNSRIVEWLRVKTSRQMYRQLDIEDIANVVLFELSHYVLKENLIGDKQSIESLLGICRMIAKRRCIDEIHAENCLKRSGGKLDQSTNALSLLECKSSELNSASSMAVYHEQLSSLRKVLSPRQMRIVELRYGNWLTTEIAEELGTTTRTVDRMISSIQEITRRLLNSPSIRNNQQPTTNNQT